METNIEYKKVYGIVRHIQRSDFDYTVFELERKGLQRICIDYNVGYDELSEAEKEELWKELMAVAEEIEFKRYFEDIYNGGD